MNGLTQIKIYNQRSANIEKFGSIINKSTKATIGYDLVSRGFGYYQTLISNILLAIGVLMGVAIINTQDKGLLGITIVYLVLISEFSHWILKQLLLIESLMVSAKRMLMITTLPK